MKKQLLFIVAALMMLSANAQLDKGLVAYWPLDGNALDVSGNGHNGNYTNVNWLSDRTPFSECAAFVETNKEGIVISDDLSGYMNNTPFSLSFWFRKKVGATYSIGYLFRNECLDGLRINQSFYLFLGGRQIDLSKEQWYHIVYAKGSDSVRVYVNDSKVVSFVKNINCHSISGTTLADGLEGTLDDFRFYNRALSASEVTELYHLPSSCSTITGIDNEQDQSSKSLIRIVTPLGEEINREQAKMGLLIYQYSDGSTKKVMNFE